MIKNVIVTDLKLMPNANGRLMEVQRHDDPNFPGFGQAYVTQSLKGVIKAWYCHSSQIDQLSVVCGMLKLALFDDRDSSPTRGMVQEVIMGDLAPRLVQIPPGVWHGFQAIGDSSTFLLHLNSEPYDAAAPDEERRAYDDPKIPYTW